MKKGFRLLLLASLLLSVVILFSGCSVGQIMMGYIDTQGNIVIDGMFQSCQPFSEGYAAVMLGDTSTNFWGFVNQKGECTVSMSLVQARPFYDGVAPVYKTVNKKNSWIFINPDGTQAFEGNWKDASVFCCGLAPVQDSETELYGYIDRQGKLALDYQFELASVFSTTDQLAMYRVGSENLGRCGYINTAGETVIEPAFYYGATFSEGFAAVKQNADSNTNDWGFIDKTGKIVLGGDWAECSEFVNGLAAVGVEVDGETLYGYINTAGEWVIEPQFNYANAFAAEEGLASVQSTEGKKRWGYINTSGKWVIEAKYEGAGNFSQGLAAVHGGDMTRAY